jgi:septal ring factor EnvC (AmiA/AmiB activator)
MNGYSHLIAKAFECDELREKLKRLEAENNRLTFELDKSRESHMERIAELERSIAILRAKQEQHESTVLATVAKRDEYKRKLDVAVGVLEAVRSQMVWERDRDQLTMGMKDLHGAVTKALEEIEK